MKQKDLAHTGEMLKRVLQFCFENKGLQVLVRAHDMKYAKELRCRLFSMCVLKEYNDVSVINDTEGRKLIINDNTIIFSRYDCPEETYLGKLFHEVFTDHYAIDEYCERNVRAGAQSRRFKYMEKLRDKN